MAHLPIVLGIARSANAQNFSGADSKHSSSDLKADIKAKVFERDANTCACCGFQSTKYQDVIFKNSVQSDVRMDNLATACIFCHQCFNLDLVNTMRSGVLIWLPEIDQATLHHIARAIYVARISQGPVANAARQALDVLLHRREEVRRRLGTDDPFILANVMRDYLTDRHYESRSAKLEGVRLFPLDRRIIREADLEFNQFPQILAFWRSKDGPFGGRLPGQWVDLLLDIRGDEEENKEGEEDRNENENEGQGEMA
jgi:intracellular multiplication protein IcmJ